MRFSTLDLLGMLRKGIELSVFARYTIYISVSLDLLSRYWKVGLNRLLIVSLSLFFLLRCLFSLNIYSRSCVSVYAFNSVLESWSERKYLTSLRFCSCQSPLFSFSFVAPLPSLNTVFHACQSIPFTHRERKYLTSLNFCS